MRRHQPLSSLKCLMSRLSFVENKIQITIFNQTEIVFENSRQLKKAPKWTCLFFLQSTLNSSFSDGFFMMKVSLILL